MALMKPEDWDEVLNTNLRGAFLCSQAVFKPMMRQRYGRIINVTSVVGVTGNPGQCNYSAAKAGLIGLTRSLAREIASRNVTVNAVAPGFVETDMTGKLPQNARDALLGQIPLGRSGTPEDIAAAVCFPRLGRSGLYHGSGTPRERRHVHGMKMTVALRESERLTFSLKTTSRESCYGTQYASAGSGYGNRVGHAHRRGARTELDEPHGRKVRGGTDHPDSTRAPSPRRSPPRSRISGRRSSSREKNSERWTLSCSSLWGPPGLPSKIPD